MHGLINRAIELFLRDRHGEELWAAIAAAAGLDARGMQIVTIYPDTVTHTLLTTAASTLDISQTELLEDIGGWIPQVDRMRHILRFSGSSFEDFVLSLDDLHDRGRVVLPGLELPRIETIGLSADTYRVTVTEGAAEWCHVLAGLLRRMADDYGCLSMVQTEGACVHVQIADDQFTYAGQFSISGLLAAAP